MRRLRGPGGRFLNKAELDALRQKEMEDGGGVAASAIALAAGMPSAAPVPAPAPAVADASAMEPEAKRRRVGGAEDVKQQPEGASQSVHV